MGNRTIEVEQVETVEEEITYCNDCNRELDEGGVHYPGMGDDPDLDFCSRCLRRMEDKRPEHIERLDSWLNDEQRHGTFGDIRKGTVHESLQSATSATFMGFFGVMISTGLALLAIFMLNLPALSLLVPLAIALGIMVYANERTSDAGSVAKSAKKEIE